MKRPDSALADWSPEQVEQGKAWVRAWRTAGVHLDRVRRNELRALDTYQAIERLSVQSTAALAEMRPGSGLVEQQRWFMKAAGHRGRH